MKKLFDGLPFSNANEFANAMTGGLLKLPVLAIDTKVNYTNSTKTYLRLVTRFADSGLSQFDVSFNDGEEAPKAGEYIIVRVYEKDGRKHLNLVVAD